MKKHITIIATIMLFLFASPESFAQGNISGYSLNSLTGQTITAYSDLFVFNTQMETNRIVAFSDLFTFDTRDEEVGRLVAYSSLFTFDTRDEQVGRLVAYSDLFTFDTRDSEIGRVVAYSDLFTFDTRDEEVGRVVAYSDLFTFDTRDEEVGRLVAYSDLFTFDTRDVEEGPIVAYSDYFTFNTQPADSIVGLSDLFVFNTMPTEFLVSVTINPETGGTVTGTGTYEVDAEVTLEAIPEEGYEFLNWTDEDDNELSEELVYTFTMPSEEVSLNANFQNVVSVVDLEDIELVIYPMPANSKFHIESDHVMERVILFSSTGQIIKLVDMEAMETELDISNLQVGNYFIQIHFQDQITTRQVQVVR